MILKWLSEFGRKEVFDDISTSWSIALKYGDMLLYIIIARCPSF